MFHGQPELLQIAPELLAALIVTLYGVGRELAELVGDALGLGDLTGPDAGPLLVEYVLQLAGEYFAVLVELLGRDFRDRVASQQRQFLEGIFLALVVVELQHWSIGLVDQFHPDLLPEALACDLLLNGHAQLHLPALPVVVDARKIFQGLACVFVEERGWWCFLMVVEEGWNIIGFDRLAVDCGDGCVTGSCTGGRAKRFP